MKRIIVRAALLLVLLIGAGLWFGWTPDSDRAAMRAKYASAASRFISVAPGLSVHVRDEGPHDKPVIVLLHGSNASLQTWDDWTSALTPDYRVIRLDLPGHGLTGAHPQRDYSARAFGDVVGAVLRQLGVSRFSLAGNSMGGWIALHYAIDHPSEVTRLVLIDAAGAPELADKKLPIGFRIAATPGLNQLMAHITPRSLVEKSIRQTVAVPSIVTPAMIDRYWELLRYPGNRAATLDRFMQPRTAVDAATLARIETPVLILWGAEDRLIPLAAGQWYQAHLRGARLIVYPRIGHIPMEENAARSVADLRAWLATTPERSSP